MTDEAKTEAIFKKWGGLLRRLAEGPTCPACPHPQPPPEPPK